MKSLNIASKRIIFQLIENMYEAECLEIENKPYLNLVLERIGNEIKTAYGDADMYSLSSCYEQDEHLKIELLMCFAVIDNRKENSTDWRSVKVFPYMLRQTDPKIFEVSIQIRKGYFQHVDRDLQKRHVEFANQWLHNIKKQGFLDEV